MPVQYQPSPWFNRPQLKVKRRETPYPASFASRTWTTFDWLQAPQSVTNASAIVPQREETLSAGNPWPKYKDQWQDVGNDFFTMKKTFNPGNCLAKQRLTSINRNPTFHFLGHVFPISPLATSWPLSGASENHILDAFGATAISRVSPTRMVADASVMFGELLQSGIPGMAALNLLKRGGRSIPAKGSDAYLEFEFALKPLVADVEKLMSAVRDSEKILAQFRRDAGRQVRRTYRETLPDVTTETLVGAAGTRSPWSNPAISAYQYPGNDTTWGTLTKTSQISRERWFSGAFTYQIVDEVSNSSAKLEQALMEARKLYGLTISPEVLWNLTPWSWAIDWFTNMGDVISNVSMFLMDGLVMRYGYVMETTTITDTYTLAGHRLHGLEQLTPTCSFTTVTKVRRRASPFGFGIEDSALTPRQLAIIAALAISRGSGRTR